LTSTRRRRSLGVLAVLPACLAAGALPASVPAQARGGPAGKVLLGDQAVARHRSDLRAGHAAAFRLRTHLSGVAGAVRVYVDSGTTARAVAVGIYSNARGHPGALLSSGIGTSVPRHAWVTVSVTPTPLASGQTYWLAVLGHGGTLRYRSSPRRCPRDHSAQMRLRGLPRHWHARRARWRTHCPMSAYVTTAVSAPPFAPVAEPSEPAPRGAAPGGFGSSGGSGPPPTTPPVATEAPRINGSAFVGERLTASTGAWTGTPTSYSYRWQSCNFLGEACFSIGGATASSYVVTGSDLGGTVRVVVTAANQVGSTEAASAPTGVIGGPPPPPANVTPPVVSGSSIEGQTLATSTGSWTESPVSFAYQWQDCNASGGHCSTIAGAAAASLTLTARDVGHTVRSVVKATNAGGTGKASSAPSPVVVREETSETACFENPESEGTSRFEGCGYPGPGTAGVANCSALGKTSGSKTITTPNETISGTAITGNLVIAASGVTLSGDCVIANGAGGTPAIRMEGAATGFTISGTTVRAENSTSASFEQAISNDDPATGVTVVRKSVFEDCGECLHGSFEVTESYVLANQKLGDKGLHREAWYLNNGTAIARDDTLLVPENQTAVIFANVANGVEHVEECSDRLTLENSLVAGSGQMIQTCGPRSLGNGTATLTVRGNRFARCLTMPVVEKRCSGHGFEGADAHGYFPEGGWISVLGEPPWGAVTWEANVWDDNLSPVAK
jgi:hypothetical protein